jgi:hypothetical protein
MLSLIENFIFHDFNREIREFASSNDLNNTIPIVLHSTSICFQQNRIINPFGLHY